MSIMEHLTEKELLAYSTGSLEKKESKEIGKHLLICTDCRDALPIPNSQRFFEILAGGFSERNEDDEKQKDKESFSLLPMFFYISSIIRQPKILALGSTGLVVILSFIILFWINSNPLNHAEREMAATFEIKESDNDDHKLLIGNHKKEIITPSEKTISESKLLKKDSIKVDSKKKINRSSSTKVKKNPDPNRKVRKPTKIIETSKKNGNTISSTRGGNPTKTNCDKTKSGASLQGESGEVVFRWKKFPKATKYHLYISDDEEILIDEYETQTATSYVLTKSLDPSKNYKWKILVTLENGKTIIGMSKKFTIKNFKDRGNLKNKGNSDVRCSEKADTVK